MIMKVMVAEDLRKSSMQTAGYGEEGYEARRYRRAVTGRKDMKEMAEDVRKSFMRARPQRPWLRT